MDNRLILVTLLIRLGVAAAISSVLVRARRFRVLLFREERTLAEKMELVFIVSTPILLGVLVRHWVRNFLAADIAFEGAILMGVIGGRLAGAAGGALVSLPALFLGEWLTLPMNVLAGLLAGLLRHIAGDREAIWSFSPLFDLSIYHWIRRSIRKSFIDWQTSFFFLILALEFVRIHLYRAFPRRIFALDSDNLWVTLAIYAGTVMAVAIALKVLNNVRIEMKLEQQERLLLQARMEALQSQINPALPVQHAELGFLAGAPRSRLGARDDREAGQHSAPPAAQGRLVRAAARGGRIPRRLSRHRGGALRPRQTEGGEGTGASLARPPCAQHDPAAAGGKCRQAWLLVEGGRWQHPYPQPQRQATAW